MAGTERRQKALAKTTKRPNPIHVILMRNHGRMYTLNIKGGVLVFTVLFALVFIVVSVYAINQYSVLSLENRELSQQLAQKSMALEEYKYQAQVLDQYKQLVEELNKVEPQTATVPQVTEEPAPEPPAQPEEAATLEITDTPAEPEEPPAPKSLIDTGPPPPATPTVDADQFSLSANDNNTAITFKFTITNIHPNKDPVTGYLFIILANDSTQPVTLVPYPVVELKDGAPVDYKKGTQFSIKQYRTVRGQIKGLEATDKFDKALVMAYSMDGELIMKKQLTAENG